MWAPDRPVFRYYEAPDLTGPWALTTFDMRIPKIDSPQPNSAAHHGEVKWFGDKLVFLSSERNTGEQFIGIINQDNPMDITWTSHSILTPNLEDSQHRSYKNSILPWRMPDGTWRLAQWITGIGGSQKVLRFGLSEETFTWTETS